MEQVHQEGEGGSAFIFMFPKTQDMSGAALVDSWQTSDILSARYGMVWYGMVWYGLVWYGMVWYGCVVLARRTPLCRLSAALHCNHLAKHRPTYSTNSCFEV